MVVGDLHASETEMNAHKVIACRAFPFFKTVTLRLGQQNNVLLFPVSIFYSVPEFCHGLKISNFSLSFYTH